ncbi:palmitoyltransferase ZDHHC15-like [Haliaeetus albicilla]|uniref:palmitoyltransferase ZDHHC15-like n=1 Tax=Haliaeetus albicilla TaxID=8969 RepID=UPI0037E8F380
MSYADKERYENEERPEVQRQILAEIARKLPVYTRTGNGGIRFCDRCQLIKPDRCHHCTVCAICVLKMDHHCPWVNNCIGFSNYKFFLLFLAYSLLYCLYIAATVFKYFIKYWTGELMNGRSKFHVLFLLFVAIMFFVTWRQRIPHKTIKPQPKRQKPCSRRFVPPLADRALQPTAGLRRKRAVKPEEAEDEAPPAERCPPADPDRPLSPHRDRERREARESCRGATSPLREAPIGPPRRAPPPLPALPPRL